MVRWSPPGALVLCLLVLAPFASSGQQSGSGLPLGLTPLEVEGSHPAVFVAPAPEAGPGPWPLTVILHGNFDRPEWECDLWAKTASARGWLLCPRGVPRADVDPRLDRWTYAGRAKLAREIEAGVSALEARFPGRVRREEATLIGFSLGANMTPGLLTLAVLPFRAVVLGEGGFGATEPLVRSAARHGVERLVYLCGEKTACPRRAKGLLKLWRRARIEAEIVVMPGVGHGYPERFDELGRQTFERLGLLSLPVGQVEDGPEPL